MYLQSRESLLNDIVAHIENQKVIVERSANRRRFVESSTSTELDQLLARARQLLENLRNLPDSTTDHDPEQEEKEYDVDAAAEVLAALYPHERPSDILMQHGIEGVPFEDSSEFSTEDTSEGRFSPLPADGTLDNHQLRRQRSRWRRVLRTALPLQVVYNVKMLIIIFFRQCLFYFSEPPVWFPTVMTSIVASY